jgi:ubiquinol-cytochrome c reductase cytochrome c1 subunit
MRRIFTLFFLLGGLLAAVAQASEAVVKLDDAHVDLHDRASLQRGAKYFVNYCLSCHSAAYSRYNRVAQDLSLTDEQVEQNLIFTGAKVGDLMTVAMRKDQAKQWFGGAVPDLTLVARSRGSDWLYTYLRAFYLDEKRPFGVNNLAFPDVAMPHVLWELQGLQVRKAAAEDAGGHGKAAAHHAHAVPSTADLEIVQPGKLSERDYDRAVRDLVNFMAYLSEPAQTERKSLGFWVLAFLVLLFAVSYAMKREYWKDVH